MKEVITKIIFVALVITFFVSFAGIGVASLFYKVPARATVKSKVTITKDDNSTEQDDQVSSGTGTSTTTPSSTQTTPSTGTGSNSGSSTTPKTTTPVTPTTPAKTTLTAAVVAQHNTKSNCWIILSGVVYNLSTYNHSGGASHISCGTDQTAAIHSQHGTKFDSYFSGLGLTIGALGSQI